MLVTAIQYYCETASVSSPNISAYYINYSYILWDGDGCNYQDSVELCDQVK